MPSISYEYFTDSIVAVDQNSEKIISARRIQSQ